jgi:pimeloyl-ACP methyl ester carboxylesterase
LEHDDERRGRREDSQATPYTIPDTDDGVDRERFRRHLDRAGFYPYPGPPDRYEESGEVRRGRVRMIETRFASRLPSGYPENDTAVMRFFRHPRRAEGQPIVLLHGYGAARLTMWESLAGAMAFRGFPTLLLCLPYLCERAPESMPRGYAYMSTAGDIALPAYEQAVADTRAALDWLLSRSPCAGGTRGAGPGPCVAGVSLGALIAVIAAGMEPRFASVVSVLGGGDLDIIVFRGMYQTTVPEELRQAHVGIENRRRARRAYQEYLEEVRKAKHPLDVSAAFHFFLFDPLTFAHHLRKTPALMLNGLFDPIIPREAVKQLWLELGKPEIAWFWGTHWAGGPWMPFVSGRIARFLRSTGPGARREPEDSAAEVWIP